MGILPTVSKGLADMIRPDYRKPVVQVYQEVLLAEMAVTGRADLLSECLMPKESAPAWSPTWVPNWTLKREWDLYMQQQCSDGQSAVAASRTDQGTLRIRDVLAATVADTLEFPPLILDKKENKVDNIAEQPPEVPPVVALIKEIAEKLDLSDTAHYRPSDGSNVLEALCYAFSGGGHLKGHLSDQMISTSTPSMAQFRRLFKFALDFNDDDASAREPGAEAKADVLLCTGNMVHACRERALLVTREGYVGAGPAAAQPGDKIAVLLGCMRPLVLRSQKRLENLATAGDAENDANTYAVVGPCNAHGLNWGELLLGPLPEGVTFIWSPSGPSGDAGPAFRNSRTGEEAPPR